ncbi:hypothetical protein [Pantoea agglomerans]|uniref:hypothetical protein n=1 Tax=Enterobacter agglomerans TaxID=549 RepID=UPI00384D83F3
MEKKQQPVQIVNAICGSGKSYNFRQVIEANPAQKYLIVMPTENLIDQYQNNSVVETNKVIREDGKQGATRQLKACLSEDFHINVILCTHEAFKRYCREATQDADMQKKLKEFTVLIDEVPEASIGGDLKIEASDSFGFMQTLIERDGLLWADPENLELLKQAVKEREGFSEEIRDICYSLLSGSGALFVKESSSNRLVSFAINPVIYTANWCKEFVLLGAGADESELAVMMDQCNIGTVKADKKWQPDENRNKHRNTSKITLVPALDGNASMTSLAPVYVELLQQINRKLKLKPFIYATNKDKNTQDLSCAFSSLADDSFKDNGERVSMASHGLNIYAGYAVHGLDEEALTKGNVVNVEQCYKGYTQAAYLGVVNFAGQVNNRFREYCRLKQWDYDTITEARRKTNNYESCYQFLCRTAIRDQKNNRNCVFIVPDVGCAEYLKANYFPKCIIDAPLMKKPRAKMVLREQEINKHDKMIKYIECREKGMKQKDMAECMNVHIRTIKNYAREYKLLKAA